MAVNEAEGAAKTVLIAGHGENVNVVGHQAIGPHFHAGALVIILEERLLAPANAMSDVVGMLRRKRRGRCAMWGG